jgi:type VI secretion system protein VasI
MKGVMVAALVVCFVLGFAPLPAVAAASTEDFLAALQLWNTAAQACHEMRDTDAMRLLCYDAMAMMLAQAIAGIEVAQGATVGKWQSAVQTNPLDDTKTVVLLLEADSGKSSWGETILLVLRCRSGVTEAYVNWKEYLGDEATVTWRIGSAQASASEWGLSTDQNATFFPSSVHGTSVAGRPRTPIEFVRALMVADQFVAQITPFMEDPVTAVFDVRGLGAALKSLQVPCGW